MPSVDHSIANQRTDAFSNVRRGIKPVDLLFILAAVVFIATLIAIRASGTRESSRRMACESNLRNVFLALESYSFQYGYFPIGSQHSAPVVRSEPIGYHHNWITGILPMIQRPDLFDQIDFDRGVYAVQNQSIAEASITRLMCPAAEKSLSVNASAYAGVTSSTERPIDSFGDGMMILNRNLSAADAVDGQSYVMLLGEKSVDFGMPWQWNSGTRATLRNTGHSINEIIGTGSPPPDSASQDDPLWVGGFSSNHIGGAYFLFVDGSFRFLTDRTDIAVLQHAAARADWIEDQESQ